jgi:hypothetical protein
MLQSCGLKFRILIPNGIQSVVGAIVMKSSPQKEMVMMITALKLRRIRDSFIIELLVSLGMVLDIKIPILVCILLTHIIEKLRVF